MEILDYLLEFQDLDFQIDVLNTKKRNSNSRSELLKSISFLKKQQERLLNLDKNFIEKTNEYEKFKSDIEDLNIMLKDREKSLIKRELNTYDEIERLENENEEIEDRVLRFQRDMKDLIKEIDILNKELRVISSKIKNGKEDYEKIKNKFDLETKDIDNELKELKVKQESIRSKINKNALRKYESVREKHTNALAFIENDRCGGCNMALASLVIQRVKTKDAIINCENCGRILFVK